VYWSNLPKTKNKNQMLPGLHPGFPEEGAPPPGFGFVMANAAEGGGAAPRAPAPALAPARRQTRFGGLAAEAAEGSEMPKRTSLWWDTASNEEKAKANADYNKKLGEYNKRKVRPAQIHQKQRHLQK